MYRILSHRRRRRRRSTVVIQGKEIKKNLGSINDMLFDMGEPTGEDSVRYQKDLKAHEKKIKNLAKKPPI